jgi:hypothetical protein
LSGGCFITYIHQTTTPTICFTVLQDCWHEKLLWVLLRMLLSKLFTGFSLSYGLQHNKTPFYLRIHSSSGIRTHDVSVGAGEDSSRLKPRGHCDRPIMANTFTYSVVQTAAWRNDQFGTGQQSGGGGATD